jgi:pimeloyl-ACP methyl ester carboxylesterase
MNHLVESGFAAINGTKTYYEMTGDGFPLVLIHAGICDSRMWDDQVQPFAQHYRVVRYDLRGYGQTAPVNAPYALHGDLHALLNALGVEQAHLLGCSMGGGVILDFVLEHPTRVASITLVGSAPSGYVDSVAEQKPAGWDEIVAAFERGDFVPVNEYDLRTWVEGPQRTPEQVDATLRARVSEMNLIGLRNEALGWGEAQPLDPPAFQRLDEIQAPTLVLLGDLDQPKMIRVADYMATHIANARKVIMPGTAHLPNMEQPENFNQIVLTFLQNKVRSI